MPRDAAENQKHDHTREKSKDRHHDVNNPQNLYVLRHVEILAVYSRLGIGAVG